MTILDMLSRAVQASYEGDFEKLDELKHLLGGWMISDEERAMVEVSLDKLSDLCELKAEELEG